MEKINFDDLISQLDDKSQQYGPQAPQANRLTISGGFCPINELPAFLKAWNLPRDDMNYCLWEEVSRIVLEEKTLPIEPQKRLQRGRIFGTGGDLSLRRDGDKFRWWFIGLSDVTVPKGYDAKNFWDDKTRQTWLLHCHEKTALLWGVWGGKNQNGHDFWLDDRVAGATLTYPGLNNHPERVQIRYWSFTRAGQVMFVWLRGLEPAKVEHKKKS